jgi:hypothetical protein
MENKTAVGIGNDSAAVCSGNHFQGGTGQGNTRTVSFTTPFTSRPVWANAFTLSSKARATNKYLSFIYFLMMHKTIALGTIS